MEYVSIYINFNFVDKKIFVYDENDKQIISSNKQIISTWW